MNDSPAAIAAPEVPALPAATPPEAVESAIVPVDTPAQPDPVAAPFVEQYVTHAHTQADVDAARTQGWQDAMAQIDAAVAAARAEAVDVAEGDRMQREAQRVARALALTFAPETCLALTYGALRRVAGEQPIDEPTSIIVGCASAIVAAVKVPYRAATPPPLLAEASSMFAKQLVRPTSAEDPAPVPNVFTRYLTAELLMLTLCRPEVVSDAELEARVATIPDETAVYAQAMYEALQQYIASRGA